MDQHTKKTIKIMVKCYLAMFDTLKDSSWRVLRKTFHTQKHSDGCIHGLFLQDIWFTYEITIVGEIQFRLIVSEMSREELELSLNNDCSFMVKDYHFSLTTNILNKNIDLLENHGDTQTVTLTSDFDIVELSFDISMCDEKIYIMLPKFSIFK